MTRRLATLILFLGFALTCVAQQPQSARTIDKSEFYKSVEEQLPFISLMPADSAIVLADRIISMMVSKEDSTHVAGMFFDYFSDCPVMGSEAVAVHIADAYFLNGKLKWPDEDSSPALFTFAEFNRSSLLGKSAPDLVMDDINGSVVDVRAIRAPLKVLYFYDVSCSTCARQTPLLVELLNAYEGDSEIAFFAIYTQSERSEWESYVKDHFDNIDNPKVTVYNIWDPELESNFQMNYGVLTTPAMFLLNSENTITGRKLDSEALGRLIKIKDNFRTSLMKMLDSVTGAVGASEESIMQLVATLFQRSNGDVDTFRTVLYEMFKYYRSIPLAGAQQGARRIAEDFILGVDGGWAQETLDEVKWNLEKMQLNSIGEKAVDETLFNKKGAKKKMLAGNKPYTVLFFNIAYCKDCAQYKQDLKDASALLKSKKAKVVSVYLSADREQWLNDIKNNKNWTHLTDEGPWSQLREDYDLGVVPRLYLLDKDKTIVAKDITVQELCEILENNGH